MALIALGVTGGIGAYKAIEVCRGLQKRGHDVVAIMTKAAARFVGPITFEAITRRPVITSQWKPGANADIEHIAIADEIALLLVAPCTANVIGKFANGIADDFLTSLYLATKAPVLIAPAMNTNMLGHDAVQRNLQALAARGTRFVEPGEGYLACGWIGKGRLAEPEDIVAAAERIVSPRDSVLRGRRVVVTAGPTYEDIDPVRYVGNRSSGRMGFAIAAAAHARGANVTLVAGPTSIEPPATDEVVRVRRASEMHAAVMRAAGHADVVIMAAAVADYAPVSPAADKIAKSDEPLTLTLQRTPDILADLGQASAKRATPLVLVGFAAETGNLLARAREKRIRKNVDLMVANDVSAPGSGFDVDTNAVTIIGADEEQTLPLQSKARVADAILDRVEQLIRARSTTPARA
ncbi:MAG TPA: bifunctional phosphopantothenoylcysteine decarboxylase/phosphopantothenate--cysteine ligase CoaBC [Vicinamibacterales bacterium]|nr:bifunctional phosphopantothenoylcysteine decarboxylase/phosphopantothenate--cysteine ligase CoaBC [Vicinamibacterales bacterium]